MKYIFNRSYIAQNNVGFIKGQEVPESFEDGVILSLLDVGIVKAVETSASFTEKVKKAKKENTTEEYTVESLDPDKAQRSK